MTRAVVVVPDPYTSPEAAGALPPSAPRRPLSAWILLVVLCAFGSVCLLGALGGALTLTRHGASPFRGPALLDIAWRVGVAVAAVFVALCIHRRRPAGRWLGLAFILLFAALGIANPDHTRYANEAERAGGAVARLAVVPAACAWWAYAFAYSSRARRYFASSSRAA